MALDLRTGFKRLFAAVGMVYGALAALVLGYIWYHAMQTWEPVSGQWIWRWDRFGAAAGETLGAARWWFMVYVAGCLAVWAIRWVARGFLGESRQP